jgi:hypothetical protein
LIIAEIKTTRTPGSIELNEFGWKKSIKRKITMLQGKVTTIAGSPQKASRLSAIIKPKDKPTKSK